MKRCAPSPTLSPRLRPTRHSDRAFSVTQVRGDMQHGPRDVPMCTQSTPRRAGAFQIQDVKEGDQGRPLHVPSATLTSLRPSPGVVH